MLPYVFTKYDVRKKYDGYTEMGRKTKENIEEKKSKVCNYLQTALPSVCGENAFTPLLFTPYFI